MVRLGELQTTFRPAGLGHQVRINIGSSPDPKPKKTNLKKVDVK